MYVMHYRIVSVRCHLSVKRIIFVTSPMSVRMYNATGIFANVRYRYSYPLRWQLTERHPQRLSAWRSSSCSIVASRDTQATVSAVTYIESFRMPRVPLRTRAGNNRFESIQQSESNRIPVQFDLSGRLQSQCQQFVPVLGKKTSANRTVLWVKFNSLLTY